ncbi:MAG TPA: lactobin A/cerein 7B family class IIb bacteriocin [Candidatus Limnocylindria bacterium]|nr:lactobin A/cerein 7B family class IIb bacteriocin [Candidatus Limnocylindria bacterium]HTL67178.1 hypothetical protein [Lacunisphaera sp.]
MNEHELEGLTGGDPMTLLLVGTAIAAAGFFAKGIVNNWSDFTKGISEGYNSFA